MLTIGKLRKENVITKEKALELMKEKKIAEINEVEEIRDYVDFDTLKKVAEYMVPEKEPEVYKEPEVNQCVAKTNKGSRCKNSPSMPEHNPRYCKIHWNQLGNKQKTQLISEASPNSKRSDNVKAKETEKIENELEIKSQLTQHVHPKGKKVYIDLRDLPKERRISGKALFLYVKTRKSKVDGESHKFTLVGVTKNKKKINITYPRLESGHYGRSDKRTSSKYMAIHKKLMDEAYVRGMAYRKQKVKQ
jgi:hypothetical protein